MHRMEHMCLKQYMQLAIREGCGSPITCPDMVCLNHGILQEAEPVFKDGIAVLTITQFKRGHCQRNSVVNPPVNVTYTGKNKVITRALTRTDTEAPIKQCPVCRIYIERNEGCAQMMCRNCKHTFCWYCLQNLDNDIFLRHYDKGPCRNKLGHSRASVMWNRTQVVGILVGLGIIALVTSPLLLVASPCIICCVCKSCRGKKKKHAPPTT
ncbi:hypothetical protein UY3_02398 [Chelonia mydas]|uniref:RING-type domain-containing protein n=1 Tax=Chelonia mydas TaxID=8469 RepID=M7CHL2_CHEMY|nr:hypothetical protein UY3_02398 [Chelonia mydas]